MLKVQVVVKEMKDKDGKKFNSYKTPTNLGNLLDLRFTRDVKNLPEENGYIYVAKDKINLAENRLFPCFWVKEIKGFEPTERKVQDLTSHFDEVDDDDLPF